MKDFRNIAFSYFSGTITPEDEVILHEFIQHDQKHMMQVWEEEWIEMGCPSSYTGNALKRVNRRIQINSFWRYATAAAAVILVCVAVFSYVYRTSSPEEQFICYSTSAGEVMRITLQDNSRIILNAESDLKVASDMSSRRYVKLNGEAWFEIQADTDHPFEVVTEEKQKVVVTGTKFNVTAYPEDKNVITTLLEGKVSVFTQKDTIQLMPYEQASLSIADKSISKSEANALEARSWINGDIVYSNIETGNLLHKLERKFGKTIQGGDSIDEELSVSFRNNESFDQIMEIIASLAGFEYSIDEKGVTIHE